MSFCSDSFQNLLISSHKPLEGLLRSKCPKCKQSRMYFCYTCYKYVEDVRADALPKIKLPIPVDIVKHPKEVDGKSTAVHAALLAPGDVHIYTYPVIPDYSQHDDVVLIFPCAGAQGLPYYSKQKSAIKKNNSLKRPCSEISGEAHDPDDCPPDKQSRPMSAEKGTNTCENTHHQDCEENGRDSFINVEPTFKKIVLIDSTWAQVHGISSDTRFKGVPRLELTEQTTSYWRHQSSHPATHLATIEALHSFFKQYHETFIGKYAGQYDDLLYFFKFFYDMVHRNKVAKKKSSSSNKTES